jgi:hypothetical protein
MSKAQDHSPQNRRPGPEEHGSPIWKKRHAGAGNENPVLQAPCFLFGRVLVRGRKEKTRKKRSGACGEGLKRDTCTLVRRPCRRLSARQLNHNPMSAAASCSHQGRSSRVCR